MEGAFWKLRRNRSDAGLPQPTRRRLLWLAVICVLVAIVLWVASPILLWAYDIQRAGTLIERGLAWPEPRRFDSLPQARDKAALDQALVYLDRAIARRPAHSQAYRMTGDVWAARSDWTRAVAAYERAAAMSPVNPLPRWEASQAYAAMQRAIDEAPRTSLMDALETGQLVAPGQLVKSLFCNENGAASCYFARTTYSLPYAFRPKDTPVTQEVLFLHPPSSLSQQIAIPSAQPALSFMVDLDPVAREWRTDGATFRVLVETADRTRTPVAELALDRTQAQAGWVLGWADLSPWAGQTVTLTIESDPGPAGDPSDDWFGWADIALTTVDAARDATRFPGFQADELRRTAQ